MKSFMALNGKQGTQVFMFRYEHVNSARKFTIVAEIVSLLRKIYKRVYNPMFDKEID